jgi:hypothetical protein
MARLGDGLSQAAHYHGPLPPRMGVFDHSWVPCIIVLRASSASCTGSNISVAGFGPAELRTLVSRVVIEVERRRGLKNGRALWY